MRFFIKQSKDNSKLVHNDNPKLVHKALYRKYRPQRFEDMIGQEHITRTLANQIVKQFVGHAYLFCGSRGTGKTTAAKIFARAVNCQKYDIAPCGQCETCIQLQDANSMDILEIDAASNNGVDEVRVLRENIKFSPVHGKYKVYIIDEVHMLSNAAFNALLKTLEEPPAHVVFVLATTEVHKLPPTILSRCMRFDFRLVDKKTLTEHLSKIFELEGQKIEQDAVEYIAMRAEGSVRDSLSLADSCMSLGDNIVLQSVLSLFGSTDVAQTMSVLSAINSGDIGTVLSSIDILMSSGTSPAQLAKDLCKLARDMLVVKSVKDYHSIINQSEHTIDNIAVQSKNFEKEFLIGAISSFSSVDGELRQSISPRLVFESVALSCCVRQNFDIASIIDRMSRFEEFVRSGKYGATPQIQVQQTSSNNQEQNSQVQNYSVNKTPNSAQQQEITVQQQSVQQRQQPTVAVKPQDALSVWGKVATWVRTNSTPTNFNLIASNTTVKIVDGFLSLSASQDKFAQFESLIDIVDRALRSIGIDLAFKVVLEQSSIDNDSELARIKELAGKDTPFVVKK